MPKIENEGRFNVKIVDAKHDTTPKDDDPHAFCITLKGETPDGLEAYAPMYFTHTMITGGRNAGKTVAEANYDTLSKLGVKDGYPGNLHDAIEKGLFAEFVTKQEEWDGKFTIKVAYINPQSKSTPVAEVNWEEVMAKFDAKPKSEAPNIEPPTDPTGKEIKDGDVPW